MGTLGLTFAAGSFSALFHGLGFVSRLPWFVFYSDVLGFFERVSQPGLPYLGKLMEYPVLTGFFIEFASVLGRSRLGYYLISSLALVFAAVLTGFLLRRMLKAGEGRRLRIYWIFAPSLLFFAVYNWDLFAVLASVAAFYFFSKNNKYLAALFLALGVNAKFYPVLYLLPLLIQERKAAEWLKIIGIFAAVSLALNLPFMLLNWDGWSYFFTLNSLRDSNPDSVWTILRFIFRGLDAAAVNRISLGLFAVAYAATIWRFRRAPFLKVCFLATLLFLIFNKIFSPQYLLWLLPFFALYSPPKKPAFYALEFSNLGALFSILPWFFLGQNILYFYFSIPFVLIRHISLVYLLVKNWR